jgi:hypothetical protein
MLQIASGMYFRPGVPLYETLHRFTVYTNGYRIDRAPIELPIASLRFSTGIAPFAPVTVEVWDRLEAERSDGEAEFMIATSGDDLVADVAAVLAFVFNTTWSTDRDLVRRLVPSVRSERPRGGPPSQLRRTFDPEVQLTDEALADAAAFSSRLLALHRPEYEKAIRAIRRVVDATLLIADDVTLAYTLFVAALESLASGVTAAPTTWDNFDGRKRALIDSAVGDLSGEQAQRVRAAVLEADALGLGRKFQTFTLDHLDPSFFRAEAVDAARPISAIALPHALNFAYRIRSRQVHALEQLAPEIWAMTDRADTVPVDGRQVLSLEGLNRLCRHVIRRYVERASTDHDASFNYREALPGIVRMQLAPQYWITHADGLRAEHVPAVLNGFLDVMLPVLRGDEDALPVNMTDVLERIEALLPGEALPTKRAPLVALYALWHRLLKAAFHRPNADALLDRFASDLDPPSVAAFAAAFILMGDVPWSTDEFAAFAAERAGHLRSGKGQPLPSTLDAGMELCLARRLCQDGRGKEAMAAVARAVEILPGNERLIALEERVRADSGDQGGSGEMDVRAFLLETGETADDDANGPGTQAGDSEEAGASAPETTTPAAVQDEAPR